MTDYTTRDAVQFALNNKNADFKSAISDLLMNKVQDAVNVKSIEVAANFMGKQDEVEIEPELSAEPEVEVEPEQTQGEEDEQDSEI